MKKYIEVIEEEIKRLGLDITINDIYIYGCIGDFDFQRKFSISDLCSDTENYNQCKYCWNKYIPYQVTGVEAHNAIEAILVGRKRDIDEIKAKEAEEYSS